MKKKRRRINFQKIFSFASLIFILVCIFWYGGRVLYFYQDSKKVITEEANTFARIVKTSNQEQEMLKLVGRTYYFYGSDGNNYVEYSNMIWRIVKINEDNTIVLISDSIVATLPFGEEETTYEDSTVIRWLNLENEEDSYGLESKLNEKENLLTKSNVCMDTIDDLEKISCEDINSDYYLGLLSIQDYVNTGGKDSFINNGKYSYLSNQNQENDVWYLNSEGQLDTTDSTEFLGVKVTITLSSTLELKSGTGTATDPYRLEDSKTKFASYVKLGEDLWRVYEEEETTLKLVANEPIQVEEEVYQSSYSKNTYYHNDTVSGSLAYYLNKTYLKSLDYQDIILENTYKNGFFGIDNNYEYQDILENTIETKVSIPSLDDVILNDSIDQYFTNTGVSKDSSLLYIRKENGMVSTKNVSTESKVVPCITISKDVLKAGTGSLSDPYRMES